MRHLPTLLIVIALTLSSCQPEVKKEKQGIVRTINEKVSAIDHNHRVLILEDDFVSGDSLYKVRGYYDDNRIIKLVGILKTAHFERDDYFYFENEKPIFSGHMMNFMDERLAEEFKYYYEDDKITEALYWEDHYQAGKRFPHEHFKEFEPDQDSLLKSEKDRLTLFKGLLEKEGVKIKEENENRGAN